MLQKLGLGALLAALAMLLALVASPCYLGCLAVTLLCSLRRFRVLEAGCDICTGLFVYLRDGEREREVEGEGDRERRRVIDLQCIAVSCSLHKYW